MTFCRGVIIACSLLRRTLLNVYVAPPPHDWVISVAQSCASTSTMQVSKCAGGKGNWSSGPSILVLLNSNRRKQILFLFSTLNSSWEFPSSQSIHFVLGTSHPAIFAINCWHIPAWHSPYHGSFLLWGLFIFTAYFSSWQFFFQICAYINMCFSSDHDISLFFHKQLWKIKQS